MRIFTSIFIAAAFFLVPMGVSAQVCGTFGVTLNVHDNDMKPVADHTIRIVPWLKDELEGTKFEPVADKPGTSQLKLEEGRVLINNYKVTVSAPGFLETEKSINFPHCVRHTYDILLLRKKDKYRITNGRVTDTDGLNVKYLDLTFTNYEDKSARTVSTDFNGNFEVKLKPGDYRITFATGAWFAATGQENFYPEVSIAFTVTDPAAHHHVPLLLSPYSYTTYRGS